MSTNRFVLLYRRAPVTGLYLAAIVLVFAAEVLLGGSNNPLVLIYLGALVPELVFAGEWWRLVSCAFLHGGVMHLLLNSVALFQLGSLFEVWVGSWRLLGALAISIFASSSASLFWTRGLSVGASGAVFGLLGALIVVLAKRREQLRPAAKSLLKQLMFWAGLNVVFGFVVPQIDNAAHLGGFVAGGCLGLLLSTRTERNMDRYFRSGLRVAEPREETF